MQFFISHDHKKEWATLKSNIELVVDCVLFKFHS